MKKCISLITAILMLATMLTVPMPTFAATGSVITWTEGVTGGAIYFDESTGAITDCDETVTEVNIPKRINGKTVTSIGDWAFGSCYALTSITIPDSVTSIGNMAFDYCEALTSITIPNSVTHIGDSAFSYCALTSITIPSSVTSIGASAFDILSLRKIVVDDNNKKYSSDKYGVLFNKDKSILIRFPSGNACEKYDIPNNVVIIEDCAFYQCDLMHITIPDSVEKIGHGAFAYARLEGNINIPASVMNIEDQAFLNLGWLTSITVDDNNMEYSSDNRGVLFDKNKTTLMYYPLGNNSKQYNIPDSVISIGDDAFVTCEALTNVTIPDSVTSIGDYSFASCKSLSSVIIPNSVTNIGFCAFDWCEALKSITIPNSVTSIRSNAFSRCDNLTIYGYKGSYAETYANENDIPFEIIGAENVFEGANITEADLYASHFKYLKNDSYGNMCGTLLTDVEEILWSRSEGKNNRSALKACLKKGVIGNLKAIYSGFSGKFTEEKDLEKKIALELVNDVSEDSLTYSKVMSVVKEMYDLTNGTNSTLKKIMESGFSEPGSKLKAANAISGGLFSSSDAYMLIECVEDNMDNIDKQLTGIEAVVDAADIAINIAASMEANNCSAKGIRDGIASRNDTALYRGLTGLLKIQRQSVETNVVDELLKYSVEKIGGALVDVASGAFGVAEFAFHVVSYFVPGADIDVVNKVVITSSNASVLFGAKTEAMTAMALNYQNGGKFSAEELGCNYALLYTAYMASVKESVEYALKIATPAQEKKLREHYNQYKEYLTYEKYIQSCLANANAQWKYSESNGEITVTGLGGSNTETASNDSKIVELFVSPVYADGENSENIIMDIPEEIDGMKVVSVSDNAFKNNTFLECITIPKETVTIGDSSFAGCTALHSVFLNENLTSVGNEAFSGCSELNEIEIPYSVETIGENAFSEINDISLKAIEDSAASQYAAENDNASVENIELKPTKISITELPEKLLYKMSEEIDSTGLKVVATLEDGSEKDVTSEVYCEFDDKQIGTNKVNVYYLDVTTSYEVEVTANKCDYTIYYVNEYGEEIADPVSGSAMAGEEMALEVKDIKGYIPDNPSQTTIIGEYNEFTVSYTSEPDINIEDATVSEINAQTFTGKQIKPQVSVTYEGKALVKDEDYYLDYGENIKTGIGTVTLIGAGKYTGIKEIEFEIIKHNLTSKNIFIKPSKYSYTGKQIKPEPTVVINGKTLVKDTDYTVSYGANKYPGYGSVTVTGIGEYTGKGTVKFTIAQVTGLKAKATGTNYIKLSWDKQPNVKGYKVYRLSGSKYKLIKTVKGSKNTSLTVKKLSSGKGYKFKVRVYVGSKPYYGEYSRVLSAPTKPGKVTMSKLSTGKTHYVKAIWKKKTGTGYQVMIATNSKFTKSKNTYTVKSYKTKSKTIKGLKKGKTYYVKVRAYKTYGGKTQYGAWSKCKKIKCK